MSNRLRTEIQEEELEREVVVKEPSVDENPESFSLSSLLSNSIVSTDSVTKALPFLFYLAFLGMVYIGNRHLAENNIRSIDKLNKEVKELSWDYKSTKADLAYKSTLTEVAKRADTLGISEAVEPPQKLIDEEVKP
ncbi:FtsL-like putative cell division protein [Mucilaginibacter lacusdianchii]|uniref:FtsL-like putative cell division protein n=1 Tax=Mucilaginibacter lacusdianchii TaxID=2684211 RepID=UPI00131C98A7|nr:FtsL-like putative cell division protein [Mucilaginibacter sp. JXJ CY 39]